MSKDSQLKSEGFTLLEYTRLQSFDGIDLQSEAVRERIEQAIELLMRGSLSG